LYCYQAAWCSVGLGREIVKYFRQKGFRLGDLKFMQGLRDHFKEQGINLKDLLSSTCLEKYTHPGPAGTMVWEDLTVVQTGWVTLKESKPVDSKPGTIPGDLHPSLREHHLW
ncbi:Nucleoside diphosphate kinase A, partial [Lemmus lemmus]